MLKVNKRHQNDLLLTYIFIVSFEHISHLVLLFLLLTLRQMPALEGNNIGISAKIHSHLSRNKSLRKKCPYSE